MSTDAKTFPNSRDAKTQLFLDRPFDKQTYDDGSLAATTLVKAGLPDRVLRGMLTSNLILDPMGALLENVRNRLDGLRNKSRVEILSIMLGELGDVELPMDHPLAAHFDTLKKWSAQDDDENYLVGDKELDSVKKAILAYLQCDSFLDAESVKLYCDASNGSAIDDGVLKIEIDEPFACQDGGKKEVYFMREQAFPSISRFLKIDLSLFGGENARAVIGNAIDATYSEVVQFLKMLESMDFSGGGQLFLLTANGVGEGKKGTCVIKCNEDGEGEQYKAYKWSGYDVRPVIFKRLPARRDGMIWFEVDGKTLKMPIFTLGMGDDMLPDGETMIFPARDDNERVL